MLKCQQKKLPRQGAVKKIGDREVCNLRTKEGLRIYKVRTAEMAKRQGHKCAICERFFVWDVQFDHEDGRGMSGSNRQDAIIDAEGNWINSALCGKCNQLKGSKRYKWQNGAYKPVEKFKEKAA